MGKRGQAAVSSVWVIAALGTQLLGCTEDLVPVCGEGTELVAGECLPIEESTDAGSEMMMDQELDCGEGTTEVDGRCQGVVPVGSACERGRECESGTCLPDDDGLPGGYCTIIDCNENRPCPAGSLCQFSGARDRFICMAFCDDESDCRGDYVCQPLITRDAAICSPSCVVSDLCPEPTRCDEDSGQCVLDECEPGGEEPCGEGELCYPDSRGLTTLGGVCLGECDPSQDDPGCQGDDVCQPLAEDPGNAGFCSPPVCSATLDCPAGSLCEGSVCQPPARCDDEGQCDSDQVCIGGPGGQCMAPCPSDEDSECADIHPDLRCEPSSGACLPVGSFPGSECRGDLNDPCDTLDVTRTSGEDAGAIEQVPLHCREGLCLAGCDDPADVCSEIASSLACADDVYDVAVCLPAGSFPGGPCDGDDTCAPIEVDGGSLSMSCQQDRCIPVCDNEDGGDVVCAGVDGSLVCADDLYGDGVDLCLPRGSFPGGPCGPGAACDSGMVCEDSRCLFDCSSGGTTLCESQSSSLACAPTVYDTPVCLPKGSFPGGPCGAGGTCAQDLSGIDAADMTCMSGQCVVQCAEALPFDDGDSLCGAVDPSLTCVDSSSPAFCALACDEGECPSGLSCLASEGACLPNGTFLGAACAAGDTCVGDPNLVCAGDQCAAGCEHIGDPDDANTYCTELGGSLGTGWNACVDVGVPICTTI